MQKKKATSQKGKLAGEPQMLAATAFEQVTKALLTLRDARSVEPISDTITTEAVSNLKSSKRKLRQLVESLKLVELAEAGRLFDFIQQVEETFSWGKGRPQLVGLLWAETYNQTRAQYKSNLLAVNFPRQDFFIIQHSLPSFLERAEVETNHLSDWLIALRGKIGDGVISIGFQDAIATLGVAKPQQAKSLLEHWIDNSPPRQIAWMATIILGCLRSTHVKAAQAIDKKLRANTDEELRLIYHGSWTIYDFKNPISAGKYKSIISGMMGKTASEADEALEFVQKTIRAKQRCDESFTFAASWIHKNAPPTPQAAWTHWVIELARECDQRAEKLGLPLFRSLIPSLLPIEKGNDGTWRELEGLLTSLLPSSDASFTDLFFAIAQVDSVELAKRFSGKGFSHLKDILRYHQPELLVVKAMNSLDNSLRHLGMTLFRVLGVRQFPFEELMKYNDRWMAVFIYTLRIERFYDSVITRFLVAIFPRVDAGQQNLKDLYLEELIYQMKNLPGACLDAVKKEPDFCGNALVQHAVMIAEKYFTDLRAASGSEINAMLVPGQFRARRYALLKDSRDINEQVEAHSVLLKMTSKSYCLYGDGWQTYREGHLDEPTKMSDYSHTMEAPRFAFIDPDGEALRRHDARIRIRELVEQESQFRSQML